MDEEARRKFSPSSALREFNPGKVLDIREKSDREEIEKFLDIAKELKRIIKAREREKCGGRRPSANRTGSDGLICMTERRQGIT